MKDNSDKNICLNKWDGFIRRLGLDAINLYTKYEVSTFTYYEQKMQKLGWFGVMGPVLKVIGNITI